MPTALEINSRVKVLALRTDVTTDFVYEAMNWAKDECQATGTPLDYQASSFFALMGSGAGSPGDIDTFEQDAILLPEGWFEVTSVGLTKIGITAVEANLIFGDGVATPGRFYWFPSAPSTEDSSNRYPNAIVDFDHVSTLLIAAGVTTVLGDIIAEGFHDVPMVSSLAAPIIPDASIPLHGMYAELLGRTPSLLPRNAVLTTALTANNYGPGPWSGGVLRVAGTFEATYTDEGVWPLAFVSGFRNVRPYNEISWEDVDPFTPTDDFFTALWPNILIYGALHYIWKFKFHDERRGKSYRQDFDGEVARMKRRQRMGQHRMNTLATRAVRRGTKQTNIGGS